MDRQTLRDWVIRLNALGVAGLRERPRRGRPPFLDEGQMAAFKAIEVWFWDERPGSG